MFPLDNDSFLDPTSSNSTLGGLDPISTYALMSANMGPQGGPGALANYVQNFEKRRAVRGSLYAPNMRVPHPGFSGIEAPSPNPGAGYGIDQNQVDAANTALAPFGLQTPTHINPFLYFHDQDADGNATWAGNHPHIAQALEGAMIGATTPGGNTVGENISNIMRTVMGIPGLYRQNAAAQMNAPFQTAGEIAGLQKTQAQIAAERAQTDLSEAHADYFRNADQRERIHPPIVNNVTGQVLSEDPDNPGHYSLDPNLQEKPRPIAGKDLTSADYVNMKNAERAQQGQPPLDSTGVLAAKKEWESIKLSGKPSAQRKYIDPMLAANIRAAEKAADLAEADFRAKRPQNEADILMMPYDTSPLGKQRYQDYLDARDAQQATAKRVQDLYRQHFEYSQTAEQEAQQPQQGDDSTISQPIAPVRVPGVTTQPGTTLMRGPADSQGRPTLQVTPMPGTTPTSKKQQPKQVDAATAQQLLGEAGWDGKGKPSDEIKNKARAIAKQRNLTF
jgi:hypothetical protein